MPRTNLADRRSDKNKLAVSAAVDAKLPPAAAAAMAWPEYKAGRTMTLSELAATSGDDIALPAGEWMCLGLCLSTTSGVGDNDRTHYLALKLVRVGPGAFIVSVCDGIGTHGKLRELQTALNDGELEIGIYVAFGLYIDNQLFTVVFACKCSASELQSMNLGQQRANVCAFNTVYALLALNPGLCEMFALGGAAKIAMLQGLWQLCSTASSLHCLGQPTAWSGTTRTLLKLLNAAFAVLMTSCTTTRQCRMQLA